MIKNYPEKVAMRSSSVDINMLAYICSLTAAKVATACMLAV